jgi:fructose-1,6-bisphosphatase/inositol monophosphatase family enzyme
MEFGLRVELLRSLADRADEIALTHFQRAELVTKTKADASPVTEADIAIETALREMIRRAFPADGLLGEEHGEEHGEQNGEAQAELRAGERSYHVDRGTFRWILDPIDGTVSFANGVPLFGTLIGLEHEVRGMREIVAGVCSMPALGERLSAARGRGATWERASRAPTPARVRPCAQLADALVCTTGLEYFERNNTTDALVRVARAAGRVRGFSDCYGGMLVATGRADAWFDPVMNPWDSGPFPVIFAEAGGIFTDWRGREDVRGGSAVAAGATVHAEMLALLRET